MFHLRAVSRCGLCLVSLLLLVPVSASADVVVGYRVDKATHTLRDVSTQIDIWYPSSARQADDIVYGNRVFEGQSVAIDGPIIETDHPVVLLALGGMRASPLHSGWIAASLARAGYVVLVPQPPAIQDAALAPRELYLRPADLRLALDHVAELPDLAPFLDLSQVRGVGFFLGGSSMLALAGARYDAAAFKRSCVDAGANPDCRWYQANEVNLHEITDDLISDDHSEPRLKAVVAINPELVYTMDFANAEPAPTPVTLLSLPAPDALEPMFRIPADVTALPQVSQHPVAGTSYASAFALCTDAGKVILAEEGESVCEEPDGVERSAAHAAILDAIVAALSTSSPTQNE